MTRVTLDGLTKHYPTTALPAVDNLSLDVEPGKLTALLGPSGGGKTTILKIIAGLLDPTTGDVRFDGVSVLDTQPEDREAVMVFQNHLLFPHMSVAQNVGFGLAMRKGPKAIIDTKVGEMLERVHLTGLGSRRPADLSGGQQQRVALARALILKPRVLLLDEPLSNLDAGLKDEMRDLIGSLQREFGITTIFVTHDQEDAVVLADRIALLLDGRLRQHGVPEQFYRQPTDEGVARFFGGVNFVAGQSNGALFRSALGPLRLPSGIPSGAGTLTIRPESIRLGPGENTLSVQVIQTRYLGTQTRLSLRHGDTQLEMRLSPDLAQGIASGQSLTIHLPPDTLWVMPPA